ncbi:MAG TPA: 2-dehydropantoate 2-reductase [Candidatus Eisenbacteria bacterium]|nr:2-dehydropantoate 2-reductase [Candidatus Eisenbacteria bacterium]
MKILVFGAGGVGSVFGGFLARTGHEVTLLGRAWHLDAIRKNGLTITGIWGDYRIKAFDLETNAAELARSKASFDLILLTVKSYDTRRAVEELLPLMKEDTVLVSLQNGLGNIETILEKVSADRFLAGRVIFGVETTPGTARVTVIAEPVAVGALPGARPKLSAVRAAQTFSTAKIPSVAVEDIEKRIWAKVVYNCALNGICTLGEMPYGEILKNDATRAWMRETVRECYAVAAKKGLDLEPPSAEAYLELLEGRLIPSTAAHLPSMLQDLRRGKRTDIDALNGAIVRLAESAGIPVPANRRIYEEILRKSAQPGLNTLK